MAQEHGTGSKAACGTARGAAAGAQIAAMLQRSFLASLNVDHSDSREEGKVQVDVLLRRDLLTLGPCKSQAALELCPPAVGHCVEFFSSQALWLAPHLVFQLASG